MCVQGVMRLDVISGFHWWQCQDFYDAFTVGWIPRWFGQVHIGDGVGPIGSRVRQVRPEGLPAMTGCDVGGEIPDRSSDVGAGLLKQFPSGQRRDGLIRLSCTARQKSLTLFTPAHHHMPFGCDGNKVKARHEVLRRRRGREADLTIRIVNVALAKECGELCRPLRVLGCHLDIVAGGSIRRWRRRTRPIALASSTLTGHERFSLLLETHHARRASTHRGVESAEVLQRPRPAVAVFEHGPGDDRDGHVVCVNSEIAVGILREVLEQNAR